MKPHFRSILVAGLMLVAGLGHAAPVTFTFDGGPLHGSAPFDQVSNGLTAHFTATGSGYSIQTADVLGFTPVGFSGYCVYPNSVFAADLLIAFSQPLSSASVLYAPEEYATDSSCTMRITAYSGTTFVATATHTNPNPGTWPTDTLSISSVQPFDHVVIHYDKAPVTGGDYGPIFMIDNLIVSTIPDPPKNVSIAWEAGGVIRTTWSGTPGATYRVDVSSDLINWTPAFTPTADATTGLFDYPDTPAANVQRRFYRAARP